MATMTDIIRNAVTRLSTKFGKVIVPNWEGSGLGIGKEQFVKMVQHYRGWTFACANKTAQAVASTRLRLYARIPSQGKATGMINRTPVTTRTMDCVIQNPRLKDLITREQEIVEITSHPFLDLMQRVNAHRNGMDATWETDVFLQIVGNGYWYMVPSDLPSPTMPGRKLPAEFWVLPAHQVIINKDPKVFVKGYTLRSGSNSVDFTEDEVIHFRMPNIKDMFYGMGYLEASSYPVTIDEQKEKYVYNLLKNHAIPPTVFKLPYDVKTGRGLTWDQSKWNEYKNRWLSIHRGADNQGKLALLQGGIDIQEMGFKPKEFLYLLQNKPTLEQISACFGVPIFLLTGEGIDKQNAEKQEYTWMKHTVTPHLKLIEQKLNEKLLPLYDGKLFATYDHVIPEDKDLQIKRGKDLAGTVVTVNELRAELGYPPIQGGDTLYYPMNMVPLGTPPLTPSQGTRAYHIHQGDPGSDAESFQDNTEGDGGEGGRGGSLVVEGRGIVIHPQSNISEHSKFTGLKATGRSQGTPGDVRVSGEVVEAIAYEVIREIAGEKALHDLLTGGQVRDGENGLREVRVAGQERLIRETDAHVMGAGENGSRSGNLRDNGAPGSPGNIRADLADLAVGDLPPVEKVDLLTPDPRDEYASPDNREPTPGWAGYVGMGTRIRDAGLKYEDVLTRKIQGNFKRVYTGIIKDVEGVMKDQGKIASGDHRHEKSLANALIKGAVDDVLPDPDEWARDLSGDAHGALGSAYGAGKDVVGDNDQFDLDAGKDPGTPGVFRSFDFGSRSAEYQIRELRDGFSVFTVNEMMPKLRADLSQAIRSGEAMGKIRGRVANSFGWAKVDPNRPGEYIVNFDNAYKAQRIARTEVIRASCAGAVADYKEFPGIFTFKMWITGSNPCVMCGLLNGKIIKMDDNFFNKGDPVPGRKYNADYSDVPNAPLHPSCVCSIIPQTGNSSKTLKDLNKTPPETKLTEDPDTGFTSVEKAEDWANKVYPDIEFDLKGCDPSILGEVLGQFRKLSLHYPHVADNLGYLGTLRRGLPYGIKRTKTPLRKGTSAFYAHPRHHSPPGWNKGMWKAQEKPVIVLNPVAFGNPTNFRAWQKLRASSGDTVPIRAGEEIISTMTHEFGHALDWYYRSHATDYSVMPITTPGGYGTVEEVFSIWKKKSWKKVNTLKYEGTGKVSFYAQRNDREGFAEAFRSLYHSPASKQHEATKNMAKMLNALDEKNWLSYQKGEWAHYHAKDHFIGKKYPTMDKKDVDAYLDILKQDAVNLHSQVVNLIK